MLRPELRAAIDQATRDLVDKGLIIEAGFTALRMQAIAPDAPPDQVREMRMAFFAGAQHLYASIMGVMEAGEEPTDNDMRRMERIADELDRFIKQFEAAHIPTRGRA